MASPAQTYRGMVDVSPALEFLKEWYAHNCGYGSIGLSDSGSRTNIAVSLSTTHGVQLNRNHFIGIGAEFTRFVGISDVERFGSLPVYAMWRMDFFGRKVTPFFDVRAGYQVKQATGFYGNVNGGIRIGFGKRTGLNVSLGVRLRRMESEVWPAWISAHGRLGEDLEGIILVRHNVFGLLLRVGVDF